LAFHVFIDRPWLQVGSEVDALFYGEWHPGWIRRLDTADNKDGLRFEVLWEGEVSVTTFEADQIRQRSVPSSKQYPANLRPGLPGVSTPREVCTPSVVASPLSNGAVALNSSGALWNPWSRPGDAQLSTMWALQQHEMLPVPVSHEQVDYYREHQAITPSEGYMSMSGAMNHPWICHMCRKRFMAPEQLPEHVVTSKHLRKKSMNYRFDEWVRHNVMHTFYESPALMPGLAAAMPIQAADWTGMRPLEAQLSH